MQQSHDKEFEPPDHDMSPSLDSHLKWVQSFESFFHFKCILMKNPSKLLSTSFKAMLSFGMRALKSKGLRMVSVNSKLRLILRTLDKRFLLGTYKQKCHLRF